MVKEMTYANGSVYDGDWKNGYKDGIGKLMQPNGVVIYVRVTLRMVKSMDKGK